MPTGLTSFSDAQTTGSHPTVVPISVSSRQGQDDSEPRANLTGLTQAGSQKQFTQTTSSADPISIVLLYQARDVGSEQFSRALDLLARAVEHLSEARQAAQSQDRVTCASEVMRFEELLQPLFECRAIGDGFANVVNSIHMCLANRKGIPLDERQITTLWRIVRETSSGPFLTFADSLSAVRELEKVGLTLNSSFIVEWASESPNIVAEEGVR